MLELFFSDVKCISPKPRLIAQFGVCGQLMNYGLTVSPTGVDHASISVEGLKHK
jgi:hypothetical protein